MRFVVRVRVDDIAAAHHLPGYDGPCARPHGHNWSLEAVIGSEGLHDEMVVDFATVKGVLRAIDHTDLNDDPDLAAGGHRPTAERLAVVLAQRVQARIDTQPNRPRLLELTVRETARNTVVYTPPDA